MLGWLLVVVFVITSAGAAYGIGYGVEKAHSKWLELRGRRQEKKLLRGMFKAELEEESKPSAEDIEKAALELDLEMADW